MKYLKKIDWWLAVLAIIALIFSVFYCYLALAQPVDWQATPKLILNSPDETANLYFSRLYAQTGGFKFVDAANQIALGLVAPRSMRVIDGFTVPASFLGLPIIFGLIGKLTSITIIPWLTPLFAIIGLIHFYLLIKNLFNKETAFTAALLTMIFPAWWYYATRGLMPNVLFVSLMIAALYYLERLVVKKNIWYYAAFGIFTAGALMVRTSEMVWLLPLYLIVCLLNYKKINWPYLLLSALVALVIFSPIFYYNNQIYHSPFSVGYALNLDLANKNIIGQGMTLAEKIFLPFGFHPQTALNNLINYSIKLMPYWTILLALALIYYLITLINRQHRRLKIYYLIGWLLVGAYLIVYYGSWNFNDNPNPEAITLANSYTRYWLPIYLFALPIIGYSATYFFRKFKLITLAVIYLLFVALLPHSYALTFLEPQDGLISVGQNIKSYQQIYQQVSALTNNKSIIIAGRMDKVFFPNRSVIFALNNSADYQKINELIKAGWPVYLFDFTLAKEALVEVNQKQYQPQDLVLSSSLLDTDIQSLYQINLLKKR